MGVLIVCMLYTLNFCFPTAHSTGGFELLTANLSSLNFQPLEKWFKITLVVKFETKHINV